jgi:hypothetical protein
VVRLLVDKFAHDRLLAEKTFDDYLGYMDESLQIDLRHMGRLVSQVARDRSANTRQIATEWAIPGALRP